MVGGRFNDIVFLDTDNAWGIDTSSSCCVEVSIAIYDATGHIVRTLEPGHREEGYHEIHWDGRDNNGESLASGIYFYVLRADDGFSDTKKMVILK